MSDSGILSNVGRDLRETGKKSLAWSVFKFGLGVAAVGSVFFLEQRLNAMGCRFMVESQVAVLKSGGVFAVGRKALKHRHTGKLLDAGYLLVVGYIIFSSFHATGFLEENGCESYYSDFNGLNVSEFTYFLNSSEMQARNERLRQYEKQLEENREQSFKPVEPEKDLYG